MVVNCSWEKTTIFILLAAASILLSSIATVFADGHQQEMIPPEPEIKAVNPDSCCQGETINIFINGTNLSEATAVDFGPGVEVRIFTVDNPEQITSVITVAADADTGFRDVYITTSEGNSTLSEGFQILCNTNTSTSIWIWMGLVAGFLVLGPGLYILFQRKTSESRKESSKDTDIHMN
jgi:hypothetical protein